MNINSLDTFVRQSIVRSNENVQSKSQAEIAASIGNAKSQQTAKARLIQQAQEALNQRAASPAANISQQDKDSRYTFSIYV